MSKVQRFYRRVRNRALDAAQRARERREAYIRAGKNLKARRALRTLRRNRKKANWALRKLRHNRKVRPVVRGPSAGVAWFDGKKVAAWMVPYLQWARKNGWRGYVVSGWRDPVYSERLCYAMCGRPSCPGRCAGRSSNHSGSVRPRGAIDVSDYYKFGQLMRSCPHQPRIFNGLGSRDPVHFSASGNLFDPVWLLLLFSLFT